MYQRFSVCLVTSWNGLANGLKIDHRDETIEVQGGSWGQCPPESVFMLQIGHPPKSILGPITTCVLNSRLFLFQIYTVTCHFHYLSWNSCKRYSMRLLLHHHRQLLLIYILSKLLPRNPRQYLIMGVSKRHMIERIYSFVISGFPVYKGNVKRIIFVAFHYVLLDEIKYSLYLPPSLSHILPYDFDLYGLRWKILTVHIFKCLHSFQGTPLPIQYQFWALLIWLWFCCQQ